jgi:hypothetical protein
MNQNKKLTIDEVMSPWNTFPDIDDPLIDTMEEEEFIQCHENLTIKLERFAQTSSLQEMLELGYRFEKDPENSMDMYFVYRGIFEAMEGYPLVELFTDTSDNQIFSHLRDRCYRGKVVRYDDSISTFYSIAINFFTTPNREGKDLEHFFTEEKIYQMSRHEVRLILELAMCYRIIISSYWFSILLNRIDVG